MAEQSNPVGQMANLHLDESTGEMVRSVPSLHAVLTTTETHICSKTELKKRQKQREAEAKKAAKTASGPTRAPKERFTEDAEAELTPNV